MSDYKTEQEQFWAGKFGEDYIQRNKSKILLAANLNLFSDIFKQTTKIESVLELGANIGMNILAINNLLPEAKTSAVEINPIAFNELKGICTGEAFLSSILDFDLNCNSQYDFVFTKGVLIHICPDELNKVYEIIYKASNKYICIAEYYNPSPVSIDYRGEKNKLFKRDFAGELLEKYQDLELINYGFKYHRDNNFPQDDLNWFLLEKTTN